MFTSYDMHKEPEKYFKDFQFLQYQLEKCPDTGRYHYQGYVIFKYKVKLSTLKNMHSTNHYDIRRGKHSDAVWYTSKDESRVEGPWKFGDDTDIPESQGQRTDLIEIKSLLDDGKEVIDIAEDYFSDYIRYNKAFDRYSEESRQKKFKEDTQHDFSAFQMRSWQKKLMEDLKNQNDRSFKWIVDIQGGKGKTTMADYLEAMHDAYIIKGGKHQDIAHAWKLQKLVVFDLARAYSDHKDIYILIENFKDGRVFSGKYASNTKRQTNVKVVVFSNWFPETERLSEDRWDVEELK